MDRQILTHWKANALPSIQPLAWKSISSPSHVAPLSTAADPVADCSILSAHASDGLMEAWEHSLVLPCTFASHSQQGQLLLCGEEDLLCIGLLLLLLLSRFSRVRLCVTP